MGCNVTDPKITTDENAIKIGQWQLIPTQQ